MSQQLLSGALGRNPVDILDKASLAAMNLSVVKRIDPAVDELLASAGHIVLYDYNISSKAWTHKGVEGTLFLVKRRISPAFQYIVLNKKSQDHHVENIDSGFKYEMSEREGKTFLLYKNAQNQVVGIWFYDKAECDKVVGLLDQIAAMPPQAALRSAPVADALPAAHPASTYPVPGPSTQHRGRSEEGFWDAGTPQQAQQTGKLLSQDGQRYDAGATLGKIGSARNPLERLFGATNATPLVSALPPLTQHHISAAPQTSVYTPSPNQPVPTPRSGGLPPFRNASNATSTPLQGVGLEPMQLSTGPVSPTPGHAPPQSAPATPFASLQTQGQSPPNLSEASSSKVASLLKPSFFAAAQTTPSSTSGLLQVLGNSTLPSSLPPVAGSDLQKVDLKPSQPQDNNLLRFFAPKGDVAPASGTLPKAGISSMTKHQLQDNSSRHAGVREAVRNLAASDAFIELFVAELEKSGVFS